MNNTKKSKFQERLDKIAKEKFPEEDMGSMNDQLNLHKMTDDRSQDGQRQGSQTAQPPNAAGLFEWISVQDDKPRKHTYVNIWDGNEVLYNWVRVECENGDYYINDDMVIKYDVTHWTYPYGYDPNKEDSEDDIKIFTLRDIYNIIKDFEDCIIPLKEMPPIDDRDSHLGFNTALRECVSHLKKVARDGKLKLHNRNTGT